MRYSAVQACIATLLLICGAAAHADGVIDRIRAQGTLHCGAVERPGVAESPNGAPRGVAVDICRAVAIAALGPSARVTFNLYEMPNSYDGVRQGGDEIAFITGSEIAEQDLARFVVPGPTILINSIDVMVPDASPMHRMADLSGQTICLMIGSRAQRVFENTAAALHLSVSRLTFEEDIELLDAYNAGNCGAVVGETTYLAGMRQNPGVRRLTSRLLSATLAADPIIAATPQTDGTWAADVAWVISALLLADTPRDDWADAAGGLPAPRPAGFRPTWRQDIATSLGSYAAIIRRNLTEPLGLPPGANALWPVGMLLPPAIR